MTKKKELKKEIEKINQIYDNEESKPIDSYIRLYTQVIREVSENLKQKTNLLNIFITEESDVKDISSEAKIHNQFKLPQSSTIFRI